MTFCANTSACAERSCGRAAACACERAYACARVRCMRTRTRVGAAGTLAEIAGRRLRNTSLAASTSAPCTALSRACRTRPEGCGTRNLPYMSCNQNTTQLLQREPHTSPKNAERNQERTSSIQFHIPRAWRTRCAKARRRFNSSLWIFTAPPTSGFRLFIVWFSSQADPPANPENVEPCPPPRMSNPRDIKLKVETTEPN
jgi:hypothetical protein